MTNEATRAIALAKDLLDLLLEEKDLRDQSQEWAFLCLQLQSMVELLQQ